MQYFCRARLAMVVMAVVLAGCEGPSSIARDVSAAPVVAAPDAGVAPPAAAPARGASLGTFRFTSYYVAVERKRAEKETPVPDEEAVLASGTPDKASGRPDKAS
jgi:hypothetical protein